MKTRYSKYKSISTYCGLEHWHQSRKEAAYCNELHLLLKCKEIKEFKIQKRYDLKVNGKQITTHVIDFWVLNKNGHEEVHEVKGFATQLWNIKSKLFEALYPKIPYIVIR